MIQNSELQIEPEAATHAIKMMALFYLLYSTTATSSKEKSKLFCVSICIRTTVRMHESFGRKRQKELYLVYVKAMT
jgi:hypothetical protein